MKVSLYVRERGTRKQKKHGPKKSYPLDSSIIWVLRYGKAWETLDVKTLSEATMLRMRRQIDLDGGWRPTTKVKQPTVLILDKAKDDYLAQIAKGRQPKTYDAYNTSLRYFYECIGNKPMKDIDRGDLVNFAAFLRDEKDQAPRSAYNKPDSGSVAVYSRKKLVEILAAEFAEDDGYDGDRDHTDLLADKS